MLGGSIIFIFSSIFSLKLILLFFVFMEPDTVYYRLVHRSATGVLIWMKPKGVGHSELPIPHVELLFLYSMFTCATCKCIFALTSKVKLFSQTKSEVGLDNKG